MSDSFAVYVARRALSVVIVVVALSSLTFVMLHVLTPESFDDPRPVYVELLDYPNGFFLHLDWGNSVTPPFLPVRHMLADAVPADIALLVGAMVLGTLLGDRGQAGLRAHARDDRRPADRAPRHPRAVRAVYFIGFLTILLFAPSIDAPIPIPLVITNSYSGLTDDPVQWLHALIVPWFVAGLPLAAMCLRMVRATLPEVIGEDFVRTAAAKGLSPRRITLLHTLPVALPPTISMIGGYVPIMLANVILVEAVFGIPGIYRLIPGAVENRNFPLLMAIVIVAAILVVVFNAIVDVILAALDPRVRA